MKKKNNALGLRQQLRKDLRKQDLQKRFKQNRSNMKNIQIETDQQEFNQIYPNIDDDNYAQYLDFFIKYLYNDQYNFMLLQLTGYIYQYLLENPQKPEGYLIIEGLSHFQEIQIPQTEQFANTMANYLFVQGKHIMNIVANLLYYPKYAACLRQYLYQQEFIQKAEKYITHLSQNEKQTQKQVYVNYLFISICTSFITTHPYLPHHHLEILSQKITQHSTSSQQYQLIILALSEVSSSSKPDPPMAQILLNNFRHVINKQYFNYEIEIINFAIYCTRCKIKLDKDLFCLLMKSLQSSKCQALENILRLLAITIETYSDQLDIVYYEDLKHHDLEAKLLSLYSNSSISIKTQCLHILQKLTPFIIKDQPESLQQLFQKIKDGLQEHHSIELSTNSLLLLHKVLFQMINSQCQKKVYLKLLVTNNLQSKLVILPVHQPCNAKVLEQVLDMYKFMRRNQEMQ